MTDQWLTVLHTFPRHHAAHLTTFISTLTAKRHELATQRSWGQLSIDAEQYFIKTTQLSSMAAKLRVTFGLPRRPGAWDWPIAEIRNCRKINQITSATPRLLGYGKIRNTFGLVHEVVLIHENLTDHTNGAQWVKRYKNELPKLIPHLIDCILELNRLDIYHLDLWLGNFMLTDSPEPKVRAIDFENCFLRPTKYLPETLGYQLGFLYECEIYKHIEESAYDQKVRAAIVFPNNQDYHRFEKFYTYYKYHAISRTGRYLIPKDGNLILGTKSLYKDRLKIRSVAKTE